MSCTAVHYLSSFTAEGGKDANKLEAAATRPSHEKETAADRRAEAIGKKVPANGRS
jgi:hypothetical protein